MALGFGKKKPEAASTEAAPSPDSDLELTSSPPKNADDEFDLSSFANQLESSDGPKAANQPLDFVEPNETVPNLTTDADWPTDLEAPDLGENSLDPFDTPDDTSVTPNNAPFDADFGLEVPVGTAPAVSPLASIPLPERKTRAEKPTEPTLAPLETAPETQVPATPKKKLVPILAVLGVLALGGGGAFYMMNQTPSDDEIETAPTLAQRPPKPEKPAALAPETPATPVQPAPTAKINPPKPAPKPAPLTPAIQAKLKTLWKQGADAKHLGDAAAKRGDQKFASARYSEARQFWKQALKVRPGHPGFQEAMDKLPTS